MAQRVTALPGPLRPSLIIAVLLALAAVAESVLDRGTVSQFVAATSVARVGGGTARVSIVLVVGLLCLSGTLPVALPSKVAAAAVVSVTGVLFMTFFGTLTVAGMMAQLIVGYRLGRAGLPLPAVAAGLPFLVPALVASPDQDLRVRAVLVSTLAPVVVLAAVAWRARREALENSANRHTIAGTLLENTARGERARIARELHDVVAHHISMIAVQSETARLATAGLPPEGAERLQEIGDIARSALTEMRRLLGVLRDDTRRADPEAGERRPQPGLGQLNELLDAARSASGAATRLIVRGSPTTLDPGVELTAYRIVQESLTNARRHAPGAATDVELHYTGDALRLRVRDNGPGPPAGSFSGGGHGLMGMRERAAAVGGEVQTGPAVGGGFLVEARLPAKTESHR